MNHIFVCTGGDLSSLTKLLDLGSLPGNFCVGTLADHICLFETLPTQ